MSCSTLLSLGLLGQRFGYFKTHKGGFMVFLFFIVGLVVAYFIWKKLSAFYIDKGRNKFIAHFAGASVGFFVWSIVLVIGVSIFPPKDTQNNDVILETEQTIPEKSEDVKEFEADQEALKKYLNIVNQESIFVDKIIQEIDEYLKKGDVYSASSSAFKCIQASDRLQLSLSAGDLKSIELNNDDNSEKLEKAIDRLSLAYYTKKENCEIIRDFLDTGKPSLVAEAEEKANNAQMLTLDAVGQIFVIASPYKISYKDNEWVIDETNSTK